MRLCAAQYVHSEYFKLSADPGYVITNSAIPYAI